MIKLLIFDLDGTLLNTLDDIADSANHILEEHHFPTHPVEAYRYFVGNGMPTLVKRILPENQREGEIYNICLKEFLEYYAQHMYDKTHEYADMTAVLERMQAKGIKIAVATNKVHHAVAPLMERFFPTIRFDVLMGQREGVPVKPDPQIVHDILSAVGCTAEETLYFGDTSVDMQTAHNAGLRAVGVLWGYRLRAELEQENAEYIIHSPKEIEKLSDIL